jgi:hypothetical protein
MAESTASNPQGKLAPGIGVLVTGAWLAWLVVAIAAAWLVLVRAPQARALYAETGVALPMVSQWALSALDWARANWQVSCILALSPLVLLIVLRKALVALVALAMTFAAGATVGGAAVALWLPERVIVSVRESAAPMTEPAPTATNSPAATP